MIQFNSFYLIHTKEITTKNGRDEHYILSERLEAEKGMTTHQITDHNEIHLKERQTSTCSDLIKLFMLYWKNDKSPGSPCLNSSSLWQLIPKTWQLVVTQVTTSDGWADKLRVPSAFQLFATLLRPSANVYKLIK